MGEMNFVQIWAMALCLHWDGVLYTQRDMVLCLANSLLMPSADGMATLDSVEMGSWVAPET